MTRTNRVRPRRRMRSQTTAIFLATLMVMATPAAFAVAQTANSNAGLEGGQDSLFDAILATPNRKTPISQDNASATAPGLEQATPTRKIEAPQGRK